MARTKSGNLSVYNSLDPDAIYKPGSMTFFYTKTGNLHVQPYPTNHRDMLEEDDDLFFDVYPELRRAKIGEKQRSSLSSRGQALVKSQALLGRIGAAGDAICIVFWTDPTPEVFGGFLSKLFSKFSQFKAVQDKVVVVSPGQGAKSLTELVGGKSAKRAVTLPKRPRRGEKGYGDLDRDMLSATTPSEPETPPSPLPAPTRAYSPEEIEMYKRMHLATGDEKKAIMARLGVGGMGSNVEHPWKKALRQAGLPGGGPGQKWWAPTSEGFTFRDWIEYQDALS